MHFSPEDRQTLASLAVLPLGIAYLELIFKIGTTGPAPLALLITTIFSAAVGVALSLVCSLLPSERSRRIAKLVTLAALGVVFAVEHFVYQQFKVLYSPITVLAGAGGVATQFGGEAASLVLQPVGLLYVLLYLLPALAYAYGGMREKLDPATGIGKRTGVMTASLAVGLHVLALLVVTASPLSGLYGPRYSFEGAASSFGLVTGLRKEAQSALAGDTPSFETVTPQADDGDDPDDAEEADELADESTSDKDATDATAAAKKRKKRRRAALDIDFDALASSTDNATWAELDRYVSTLTPSKTNKYTGLFKGYNLIFISAEAFTAEAIRPDITPTLYKMWDQGIKLNDYYQFDTAGTTGGECANLFGLLATEGGSSVKMTSDNLNYYCLGTMLDREGYNGWAFHNNTYTYYGRDATHVNLGYNHGYMGYGNGMEEWVTWQWPQSDLEMIEGTFDNLYGEASPFNVYYMSVSGHSNYDPGDNMMAQKNWDVVADLPYSDRVKGYLGANVELDRAMEALLKRLKKEHIYRKTVIVISADHFPYGLDDDGAIGSLPYLSELYGYNVTDVFQRDHNTPIIWCGALPKKDLHISVDSPSMSIDLLPTLSNLFGVKWDSRLLPGRDVLDPGTEGIAFNLNYDWRTELGTYWAGTGEFVPVEGAEVPDGYVEAHNALVSNKISYCHGVLTSDYYRHIFG